MLGIAPASEAGGTYSSPVTTAPPQMVLRSGSSPFPAQTRCDRCWRRPSESYTGTQPRSRANMSLSLSPSDSPDDSARRSSRFAHESKLPDLYLSVGYYLSVAIFSLTNHSGEPCLQTISPGELSSEALRGLRRSSLPRVPCQLMPHPYARMSLTSQCSAPAPSHVPARPPLRENSIPRSRPLRLPGR